MDSTDLPMKMLMASELVMLPCEQRRPPQGFQAMEDEPRLFAGILKWDLVDTSLLSALALFVRLQEHQMVLVASRPASLVDWME